MVHYIMIVFNSFEKNQFKTNQKVSQCVVEQ